MRSKELPSKEDWEKVGKLVRQASVEIAQGLGGQELASEVISLAGDPSSNMLPDPSALGFLEARYPGTIDAILSRAKQIQIVQHRRERKPFPARLFKR